MKKALGLFFLLFSCIKAQEPGVTIRQTVQEVVLEVMVRDSRGRVVKNLKPSDLEVYEDGVLQKVQSFKLVEGREVVTRTRKAAAPVSSQTVTPNPLKAVNLVCIVFCNI